MLTVAILSTLVSLPAPPVDEGPFRQTLTSTSRNVHVLEWETTGRVATPDCPSPWSVTKRTLHGGKQEGVDLIEIDNGKLSGRVLGTIVDADAKAAKFRQLAQRLGAAREQTVAIGDGANDLKMMAEAGTSIAYRAKPVVRAKATYSLNYTGLDGVLNLFD